jgi:hypothetical protein
VLLLKTKHSYCKQSRKTAKKPPTSNPIKAELGGYMPLRNEFEFPYNDQAEVPVATVKFSESDTPEEREIKVFQKRSFFCVFFFFS